MALDTNALITLANLKIYLKESGTDHDDNLEMLINSVSTEFDGYLDRALKKTAYTNVYLDGNGQAILYLPNWPVDSSATFTLIEDGETLTEGDDKDFRLYADEGYVVRLDDKWPEGYKIIELDAYTAGYTTVPKDVQLACMKWVAWEFQQLKQKRWGETSRTDPEAGSVSTFEESIIWKEIKRVIDKYRRFQI